MFNACVICKETKMNLKVKFFQESLPKKDQIFKIKKKVHNKQMNVYRITSVEYATYVLHDNKNTSQDYPAVQVEIKCEPVYYNFHHDFIRFREVCCDKCPYFKTESTKDERGICRGVCDHEDGEKFGKVVFSSDICLYGFREMSKNLSYSEENKDSENEDQ